MWKVMYNQGNLRKRSSRRRRKIAKRKEDTWSISERVRKGRWKCSWNFKCLRKADMKSTTQALRTNTIK